MARPILLSPAVRHLPGLDPREPVHRVRVGQDVVGVRPLVAHRLDPGALRLRHRLDLAQPPLDRQVFQHAFHDLVLQQGGASTRGRRRHDPVALGQQAQARQPDRSGHHRAAGEGPGALGDLGPPGEERLQRVAQLLAQLEEAGALLAAGRAHALVDRAALLVALDHRAEHVAPFGLDALALELPRLPADLRLRLAVDWPRARSRRPRPQAGQPGRGVGGAARGSGAEREFQSGIREGRKGMTVYGMATQFVSDMDTDEARAIMAQVERGSTCRTGKAESEVFAEQYRRAGLTAHQIRRLKEARAKRDYLLQAVNGETRLLHLGLDGAALAICGASSTDDHERAWELLDQGAEPGDEFTRLWLAETTKVWKTRRGAPLRVAAE